MKKLLFLLFLVFTFTISSCEKAEDLLPPQKFKSKDFPISVGSFWQYHHTDSIQMKSDTLKLTVVAEGLTVDDQINLFKLEWTDKNGAVLETQYAQVEEDSISFYTSFQSGNSLGGIHTQYNFPFKVEDEWQAGDFINGEYLVLAKDEESSRYGMDYGTAFLVQKYTSYFNAFIDEKSLLVKDIGIVWRRYYHRSFGTTLESWNLIDYQIAP